MIIRHTSFMKMILKEGEDFVNGLSIRECSNRSFLVNFVIGGEAVFSLSDSVDNLNVRMYAPVYQQPDFCCDVSIIREKVTVSLGLCDNGDMLGPFFSTEMLMEKAIFIF